MVDYSAAPQTSNGEVRIGIYTYPVAGEMITQLNLARWPPKITAGDYSLDSDPTMSSWILSSFNGGIGNYELKPGVDDYTYWTGTLETRYPEGPTLLPKTNAYGPLEEYAGTAYPLGDFYSAGDDPLSLGSFAEHLHYWSETGKEWRYEIDLTSSPVRPGVNFEGEFHIPLGAFGIDTLDTVLVVTNEPSIQAIDLIVWDNKLCALAADGNFYYKAVGGSWTAQSDARKAPSSTRARRLVNFINSQGDPTLYVITNTVVYAFDPEGGTDGILYETRLDYPKHPNQGRAVANWRGDTMYVSVGLGIHGYNGSVIQSMGPDGRYGLPAHLRGTILDLKGEYNALLALIQGVPGEDQEAEEETHIVHTPLYQNQDTWHISNAESAQVFSSIYRYANSQWHPVWESADATGFPTWMEISESQGAYRLWWGYGGQMYTQQLQVAFQNPKQSLLSGGMDLESSGSLITGWFDADMRAFTKLASHIEVNLDNTTGTGGPGGAVRIDYQIDNDNEEVWRSLGIASQVGLTVMPFNNIPREVGDPFSVGRPFDRIRFRIWLLQDGISNHSPLPYSIVMKFQKIPESQLSWSFTIPLFHEDGYKGVGNKVLTDYLDGLLYGREMIEFTVGNETYRTRVAQVAGRRSTGYDNRANLEVNIIEVKAGPKNDPNRAIDYTDGLANISGSEVDPNIIATLKDILEDILGGL